MTNTSKKSYYSYILISIVFALVFMVVDYSNFSETKTTTTTTGSTVTVKVTTTRSWSGVILDYLKSPVFYFLLVPAISILLPKAVKEIKEALN